MLDKYDRVAVVGVSSDKDKWGYKVYHKLKSSGFRVYAVNPRHDSIGEDECYPDLESLTDKPDAVVTVVRPDVTEIIVKDCRRLGIKKVWMQPGSESAKAVAFCMGNGIEVVSGACLITGNAKRGSG